VIITAFVDGGLFFLLPGKKGMQTVGAVVPGLLPESSLYLEELIADLAQKLSPFLPVIVIEILMGSMAYGTHHKIRHTGRAGAIPYGT
jgi:hypothetical protein